MKHDQFYQRKWRGFTGELGQHPEFFEMPETTSTQKSATDNGKPNEINSSSMALRCLGQQCCIKNPLVRQRSLSKYLCN
jgi:hypothetical protein